MRVALFFLVVFGPPVFYGLILLVLKRRRARQAAVTQALRRANLVTVSELVARIETERAIEADRTNRVRKRQCGLPPGWTWPNKDPDPAVSRTAPPPRARPYLRRRMSWWAELSPGESSR